VPSKNRTLWSSVSSWQKIAASLIGILIVSTLIFFFYRSQPIEYRTAFGEKQEIILPDSSRVILNANSTLTVNEQWGAEREVWLEGEAFFSVRKKKITNGEKGADYLKFTVHTNTMDVHVLGTEFNVSDRRQNTVVVLNSGKIQLGLPNKKENIIMKPGDLVEMEGKEQKLTRKIVDPRVYNAWTNNEWILNDLTLREVALKIEETYGVKVEIKNKSKRDHVLAGVVPTDNLNVLLKVLSTTLNIKITQHKNQIIIQ
jgi:ferric-dicitrate binding protein FerR (iron transport regulator)